MDGAYSSGAAVLAALRRRSRSPRRPPGAERLGTAQGLQGSGTLSCLAPLRAEGPEGHAFRCFELRGQRLRIREELSSSEMPTGGRIWDAGLTLAHWLAMKEPCWLWKKSVLELGSGCGLPGGLK